MMTMRMRHVRCESRDGQAGWKETRVCLTILLMLMLLLLLFLLADLAVNGFSLELPYAPSNVRISEITATSVHISWHYDGPPSEAVEFVIQYKPKLAPTSDQSEVVGLKTNYYTVQNLNPFTEYEFYVVAVSAIGRGLASTATFVTTGETGKNIIFDRLSTISPGSIFSASHIVQRQNLYLMNARQ